MPPPHVKRQQQISQAEKLESKKPVLVQTQQKQKRSLKRILLIASIIGVLISYAAYEICKPYPTIVVTETCEESESVLLQGRTVAVPDICSNLTTKHFKNAFFWHSSGDNFSFINFAPCADEEKAIKCYPTKKAQRAAFVSFKSFSRHILMNVIKLDPEQRAGRMLKFQAKSFSESPFYMSNLMYRPLVQNKDLNISTKGTVYNYFVQNQVIEPDSLLFTVFNESLSKLCEDKMIVNIFHMFLDNTTISLLDQHECVKVSISTPEELCKDVCEKQLELINMSHKNAPIHLNALMRLAILYNYGGFFIEPAMLVVSTFTPTRTMMFLHDDETQSVLPTPTVTFVPEQKALFINKSLDLYLKLYNADCYGCMDLNLNRYLYAFEDYEIEIGSSSIYLPQMRSEKLLQLYKSGKFDNDIYSEFMKKDFKFWHLRYAKSVTKLCDEKFVLYEVIFQGLTGKKLCP